MRKHITAISYFVPFDDGDYDDTIKSVKSYLPYVDRYILIQNKEGDKKKILADLVDVYVINKVNKLMAGAVNMGYQLSRAFRDSEYLMFIDSGTRAVDKLNVDKLMTDGIASPHIGGQDARLNAHACLFVLHKDVFEKVGSWNPDYGNEADQDWFNRAVSLGIPMYQTDDVVEHEHIREATGKVEEFKIPIEII